VRNLNWKGRTGFVFGVLLAADGRLDDLELLNLKNPKVQGVIETINKATKVVEGGIDLRDAYLQLQEALNARGMEADARQAQLAIALRALGTTVAKQIEIAGEVSCPRVGDEADPKCTADLAKGAKLVESGTSIAADVVERKYAEATLSLFGAFGDQLDDAAKSLGVHVTEAKTAVKNAKEALAKAPASEKAAKKAELEEAKDTLKAAKSGAKTLPKLQRYVQFAIEIAQAENSEGVAAVLDTYAAPLGSYRAKYTRITVGLGGMVGAFGGWEQIDADGVSGNSGVVGGFAPIGLQISFPLGSWLHAGVMASLLDVGAITTYRFEQELDDESDQASHEPNVSFTQVFSPGVYGTVGIARSPFVIGGGLSYAPELRDVSTGGGEEFAVPAIRYGFFAAVDVPIFMF
jgi:hypothetical protein